MNDEGGRRAALRADQMGGIALSMMQMGSAPTRDGEVIEVGVRSGLFGRPVMTVRRMRRRLRFLPQKGSTWEVLRPGPMRDARGEDLVEIAEFLRRGRREQ